jgi:hypothetical protein
MRGGRTALAALGLCLSACSSAPPAEPPRDPETHAPTSLAPRPEPLYRFTPSPAETETVPGGGLSPAPTPAAPPPAASAEDVVKLQRELLARNPASDAEKLRLALLLASTGELEEAERIFGTMKAPGGKLAPYLELFLRRQLGEHREASKALAQLVEEERRATGFVIERAELCTRVRRFRDYAPAESDRVAAGGVLLLYVEPRNYTQTRQGDRHAVHLRYDWKLFDDRSTEVPVPVWDQADPAQKEDRLSTVGPVAEFYQSFRLPLPAGLAAGPYRVKVTVTDVLAGKSDRVYVPITVGAAER